MAIEEPKISNYSAKGGAARAKAMTAEERRESARRAAKARWSGTEKRVAAATDPSYFLLPKETHVGRLKIGEIEIPCSVLDNNVRVFSIRGINRAMGYKRTGTLAQERALQLPGFLAAANLKGFIPDGLGMRLLSPIQYRPKHAGKAALGYEATLFPEICEVLLDARKAGALRKAQAKLANTAETFIRGFARVGVVALVDEATGYQEDRAKDELSRILAAYISPRLMPWTQKFPHEFFRQVYRLHGWPYSPGSVKHPQYLGKFINKYVYGQFPPGVLEQLQRKNPITESGYRKHKNHQYLTVDTGDPHLDRVIVADMTLMQVADDKKHFDELYGRAIGKPQQLHMSFEDDRAPLVIDIKADNS